MFIERVKDEGLAHLSYVIGDAGSAAVIDPRRDCGAYLQIAARHGARITHIFETHRNEDYVVGSCELARRTGATIHHGAKLDFGYGEAVHDGDTFTFGDVVLRVLETPGHTDESISLAVADKAFDEGTVAVFTGDALFIGDVGRTDFYPERAREVAGLLHDSLFGKLLPLGDHVIVYPAHGAGSICGSGMAKREFSTLGFERAHNPSLIADREAFIDRKVSENHYQPPYFREMERLNKEGPPPLPDLPLAMPLPPDHFAAAHEDGMVVIDTRSPEAFAGAAVPGSLGIPLGMLPGFVGWYVPYDVDIGLVLDDKSDWDAARRHFVRLGYDRLAGYLDGGMEAWETAGRPLARLRPVTAKELKERLAADAASFTLLDVRSIDEFKEKRLPGATHLYVGELPQRLDEVSREKPVITFCGSGRRAAIAASLLAREGIEDVAVCLGSMQACEAIGCPIIEGDD